jgi:8-oxo-dGTP pyrophosphatase MutT (NUDIX family)
VADKQRIRPLVICLFRHNGQILVAEGYDPVKKQRFYRPLGGAIEFGEFSQAALVREMREELGAEVADLRYLGTLENIFEFAGAPGHEIVLVYDGRLVDPRYYERPAFAGFEPDMGQPFTICWQPLAALAAAGAPPLYPDGLLALLSTC